MRESLHLLVYSPKTCKQLSLDQGEAGRLALQPVSLWGPGAITCSFQDAFAGKAGRMGTSALAGNASLALGHPHLPGLNRLSVLADTPLSENVTV